MKKIIIAAIILIASIASAEFYPTLFTSVTARASSGGFQTATYTSNGPVVVKFRTNAAGTYVVGSGTPTPIASAENVTMILKGTATFSLASSAGASKVFIQEGSNTPTY